MANTLNALLDKIESTYGRTNLSSEEIIKEFQSLSDEATTAAKKRADALLSQLYLQNAGLIIYTANRYNAGNNLTDDQISEVLVGIMKAAKNFDYSRPNATFATYVPAYVKSALQKTHAFQADVPQSVYARAKHVVNNADLYDPLRVQESLSRVSPTVSKDPTSLSDVPHLGDSSLNSALSDQAVSAEDKFWSETEGMSRQEKESQIIDAIEEEILSLPMDMKTLALAWLSDSNDKKRRVDQNGLPTTQSLAKELGKDEAWVSEGRIMIIQRIADRIQEANIPDVKINRTAYYNRSQPSGETFDDSTQIEIVQGLFGDLSLDEMASFRRKKVRALRDRQSR